MGSRERWVVNLTNAQLSKSEVELLEKGLSFAPAPNKLPTTHLISAAEKGLSKLQSLYLLDDWLDLIADREKLLETFESSQVPSYEAHQTWV